MTLDYPKFTKKTQDLSCYEDEYLHLDRRLRSFQLKSPDYKYEILIDDKERMIKDFIKNISRKIQKKIKLIKEDISLDDFEEDIWNNHVNRLKNFLVSLGNSYWVRANKKYEFPTIKYYVDEGTFSIYWNMGGKSIMLSIPEDTDIKIICNIRDNMGNETDSYGNSSYIKEEVLKCLLN